MAGKRDRKHLGGCGFCSFFYACEFNGEKDYMTVRESQAGTELQGT